MAMWDVLCPCLCIFAHSQVGCSLCARLGAVRLCVFDAGMCPGRMAGGVAPLWGIGRGGLTLASELARIYIHMEFSSVPHPAGNSHQRP